MLNKRQKVRYEFFTFQTGPSGNFTTTLILNNPASVKFVSTGIGLPGEFTSINNTYILQPINTANRTFPSELILENNIDEIDVTTYVIRIISNANSTNLKIVCKYYINE